MIINKKSSSIQDIIETPYKAGEGKKTANQHMVKLGSKFSFY